MGVIIFLGLMLNFINENRKQKLLQNSNTTIGLLIEEYSKGKNPKGTFQFELKGKKYVIDHIGDFSYMKKGDSVLLQYSIEDPTVARVKDRYYMKKYKNLAPK